MIVHRKNTKGERGLNAKMTKNSHSNMNIISKIFRKLALEEKLNWIPTIPYLKIYYWTIFGKKLDLHNPKTFNEKLQWLKVYDRKPIYTTMVDKYEAKKYVASIIGEEYIIPTIGVWNNPREIDFDSLPTRFVLKSTHDSGGVKIVDKEKGYDKEELISYFEKRLKRSLYNITREWPYKNVVPRIIAEQYLEDESTHELRDYKIFTFDGVAKALFIAQNRGKGTTRVDYFDIDFQHLDFTWGYPNADVCPDRPPQLDSMIRVAEKLGKGIPEVRVDFYIVNGKSYFGEMTFFDGSGFTPFNPEEWDRIFGEMIKLPEKYGGGIA